MQSVIVQIENNTIMLKLAVILLILVFLVLDPCHGKRLMIFISGSGCGITREITIHKVPYGHPTSSMVTCSLNTEEHSQYPTNRVDTPSSSASPIPSEPVEQENIEGGWSAWSEWSACSSSEATQERTRSCTNPPPTSTNLDCIGDALESKICQELQPSSNYDQDQGYDGVHFIEQNAVDARKCHIQCQISDAGCTAWTWKATGMCYFYADPGQLMAQPGSISGLAIASCLLNSSSYVGGDIETVRDIELVEECQGKCQENTDCLFFTHDIGGRVCMLKNGHTGLQNLATFASGPKFC